MSLPTFKKGVHYTRTLLSLMHAVQAVHVQCTISAPSIVLSLLSLKMLFISWQATQ